MFLKRKTLKDCQVSPHYFWLIKTRKFGIVNLSGAKGKLKRIVGSKAVVNFDNYGIQTVPASLVVVK